MIATTTDQATTKEKTTTYSSTTTTIKSKEVKLKHNNNGWFYFTNNQPGLLYQSFQSFPSNLTELEETQNIIPTFPLPWFYPSPATAPGKQNFKSQPSNPR